MKFTQYKVYWVNLLIWFAVSGLLLYLVDFWTQKFISYYISFDLWWIATFVCFVIVLLLYQKQAKKYLIRKKYNYKIEKAGRLILYIGLPIMLFNSILLEYKIETLKWANTYWFWFFVLLGGIFYFWLTIEKINVEIEKLEYKELLDNQNSSTKESNQQILFLSIMFVFILAGIVLRIWNLGKVSYNSDEFTVNMVANNLIKYGKPIFETGYLYFRDFLHTALTALVFQLFGATEFWQRIISVIFGIGAVGLIYLLVKELSSNKNLAIFAAAWCAIDPWFIEYSRYGKSYIMVVFLALVFLWLVLKKISNPSITWAIIISLVGVAALFTHALAQIILFFVIAWILSNWREIIANPKNLISYSIITISFVGSIIAAKILTRYEFYYQAQINKFTQYAEKNVIEKFISFIPFSYQSFNWEKILYFRYSISEFYSIIMICLILSLLILLLIKETKFRKKMIVLGLILIFYIFSYEYGDIAYHFQNKGYLIFVSIMIVFSSASVIFLYKKYQRLVYVLTIILLTVNYFPEWKNIIQTHGAPIKSSHSVFEGFVFKQDNKNPALFLKGNYISDTDMIIVMGSPLSFFVYTNIVPEYYVFSGDADYDTPTGENVYVSSKKIKSKYQLENIIDSNRNKRIWLLSTYSMLSGDNELAPRIWHIGSDIQKYINELPKNTSFVGEDGVTTVYLLQ